MISYMSISPFKGPRKVYQPLPETLRPRASTQTLTGTSSAGGILQACLQARDSPLKRASGPRFLSKGSFQGDVDTYIYMYMDIDLDMAVYVNWGVL